MATFPWYRGETYKFSLLLHDKAGAVISEAFTGVQLFVRPPDSTIIIPGAAETVLYEGQPVTGFSFVLDDTRLGAAPIGIHYAQLWGTAGLGAKMITADIAIHIKEGTA